MYAEPVIDSSYNSLEEAIQGSEAPADVRRTLALVNVKYVSFDGDIHWGQVVVSKDLAKNVQEIFASLLAMRFPIKKVVPIVAYDWDDERSMQDNNSSAFNYRPIIGTNQLSNHSYGRALDLNPLQNPYFARDGKTYPVGAVHNSSVPGTIIRGDSVVSLFASCGWDWLGECSEHPDFQHFEKSAP